MSLKQIVLHASRWGGLSALARRMTGGHLRILGYHGLWVTPGYQFGDCSFMGPDQFDRRMAALRRSGLDVLPLGEAVDRLRAGTLTRATAVITIDDGWVSTLTHMLPILRKYDLPATLYATTWYSGAGLPVSNMAVRYLKEASGRAKVDVRGLVAKIDAMPSTARFAALRDLGRRLGIDEAWIETRQFEIMSPAELRQAHEAGLDIQLHSHRHIEVGQRIHHLSAEIATNRAFLAEATGSRDLDHFCYPCGSYHDLAPSILKACGIKSATLVDHGINPPRSDPYRLRRLLDGRSISDAEFDAYLTGALHFVNTARSLAGKRHRFGENRRPSTVVAGAPIHAEI